jgi:hypothetical protein
MQAEYAQVCKKGLQVANVESHDVSHVTVEFFLMHQYGFGLQKVLCLS